MLQLHSSVAICGKVLARCVAGNIIMHGFAMNSDVGWQKVFSPSTHSLLTIRATDGADMVDDDDADDWMLVLQHEERLRVKAYCIEYPTILLLQQLVCPVYDFVTSSSEYRMLHRQVSGSHLQSVDVTIVGTADSNIATIVEPESFSCTAKEFAQGVFGVLSALFDLLHFILYVTLKSEEVNRQFSFACYH